MKKNISIAILIGLIIFISNSCNRSNKNFYEEIEVRVISNSIIVPVEINNKKYNFLLDTGASNAVSNELSDILDLKIKDTVVAVDIYENKAKIKQSNLPELKIGNSSFNNLNIDIRDPIQSFSSFGMTIDGVLGGNFFTGKILQINFKDSKIIITNKTRAINLNLEDAIDLELVGEQNMPVILIEFPSKNSGEYVNFDTGSNNHFYRLKKTVYEEMYQAGALNDYDVLYQLNNEHNGSGEFGPQKDSINHVILFDTLKIGKNLFLNTTATTFKNYYSRSILGAPLLQEGIVTIDYINKKFYYFPYNGKVKDFKPKHGCYFSFKNGKFYVEYVIPNSIAAMNGVKKGYVLKRFNSIIYDSLSTNELLNLNNTVIRAKNNDIYVFMNEKDKNKIEIEVEK